MADEWKQNHEMRAQELAAYLDEMRSDPARGRGLGNILGYSQFSTDLSEAGYVIVPLEPADKELTDGMVGVLDGVLNKVGHAIVPCELTPEMARVFHAGWFKNLEQRYRALLKETAAHWEAMRAFGVEGLPRTDGRRKA